MGVVTFNGKKSTGIFEVSSPPDYEIPERIYETVTIPGRNGDLLIDTGSYGNVERSYNISCGSVGGNFTTLASAVSNFFNSGVGYLRLEDTYEPNHFFLAKFKGPGNIGNVLNQAGVAQVTFDRKPERFLKSGDTNVTITSNQAITNPTIHPAKPFIKVYGTGAGTIVVNNYKIEFTQINSFVYVNSDIEDVYKDAMNMNHTAKVFTGFPILKPGVNNISFTGAITKLEIKPRWWTV